MTTSSAPFAVRPYQRSDEPGWLRCRVLSFLDTQYHDDVKQRRTELTAGAIALVAVTPDGEIVGVLDIEVAGDAATIDTIATHPDHQGAGVATAMLQRALPSLERSGVVSLDAWTREDAAANRWYRHHGFLERSRHLHVYLQEGDDRTDFSTPDELSAPLTVFAHADIEDEERLRSRYRRVHVCRQYLRPVVGAPASGGAA